MVDRRLVLIFAIALGVFAPAASEAQPVRKVRIAYLSALSPHDAQEGVDAFRAKLRDLGRIEGQNLVIEYRYAAGHCCPS